MKIALYAKHQGLALMLKDLLSDHDVRLQEEILGFEQIKGDEDIEIATFAYDRVNEWDGRKPLIVYVTDPVPFFTKDRFIALQNNPNVKYIVAEDCYLQEMVPLLHKYKEIPFAINSSKYIPYNGSINKVLIVNRKPHDRWTEVVRGAIGTAPSLDQVLEGIPYDICHLPDVNEYRKALSDYKVMMYFSNSPFTIVMFEGMAINMPMIAWNHTHPTAWKPITKYIHNFTTDIEQLRRLLKEVLDKPPKKEYYITESFSSVKEKWNMLLNSYVKS
jgi:hypothetical protein